MTDKIIEAARAAGFSTIKFKGDVERIRTVHSNGSWVCCTDSVAALYAVARAEALEDAAKVCDEQQTEGECPERASYCAGAIRALKEQQHG